MQPTATNENGVRPYKAGVFEEYVTFCALGGLLTDDDGSITTMSRQEFCDRFGVDRVTLWRWKRETPDWGTLIRKRRDEIVPWSRETAALNRLYVIGMGSVGRGAVHHDQRAAVDALKTYTGHHSGLRLPTQPHQLEVGNNLMELAMSARRKNLIEGEVVERANDAGVGVATPDGVSETAA